MQITATVYYCSTYMEGMSLTTSLRYQDLDFEEIS